MYECDVTYSETEYKDAPPDLNHNVKNDIQASILFFIGSLHMIVKFTNSLCLNAKRELSPEKLIVTRLVFKPK